MTLFFRMIQAAFIDMENMFELLEEQQEVRDIPEAPAINMKHGAVEFKDVSFHYNPAYVAKFSLSEINCLLKLYCGTSGP